MKRPITIAVSELFYADINIDMFRIVYKDNNSSFKDAAKEDYSLPAHHRNIQSLSIKLFKVKGNLSKTVINDILQTKNTDIQLRVTDRFCEEFCQH